MKTSKLLLTLVLVLASTALAPQAGAQTEGVLYSFTTGDGAIGPAGGVVMDSAGNLYGLADSDKNGAAYELTPSSDGVWALKILYEFGSSSIGGGTAGLTIDAAGNLYGVGTYGGNGFGGVYELKRLSNGTWREQVLYAFANNATDGRYPDAKLIMDAKGNIYGTTQEGGLKNVGVVFELTPYAGGSGWNEKILYSLPYKQILWNDLNFPLSLDHAGNLYGVSDQGDNGPYVFELSPTSKGPWTMTTLYTFGTTFSGPAPSAPWSGVYFDSIGNLYGVTAGGGSGGEGTVYQLSPSTDGTWTERNLYDFPSSCSPACLPEAEITVDASGNIFGTAAATGSFGVAYEVSPNGDGTWAFSILHSFEGGMDGNYPGSGAMLDVAGTLYGTTLEGGGTKGRGTVYEITP